ncbi:hypothetical protein AB0M91_02385 [Micromonospora rifamycinica]|uniref:hypothetical protein n=1 Tax=Micromonospora rifamycinica TaxID=291594 RepID=UPI00342EF22C
MTGKRFTVPVRIETNDLLFTVGSDRAAGIQDVLAWFDGNGTLADQHAGRTGAIFSFHSSSP